MRHELKTWPEYYEKVASGKKTFEVRKLDRFFNIGDILVLKEWSPVRWKDTDGYSGKEVEKKVTYVMNGGEWDIPEGICIMGIQSPEVVGESNQDELWDEILDANCRYLESSDPRPEKFFKELSSKYILTKR